jgi:hypothetical protein
MVAPHDPSAGAPEQASASTLAHYDARPFFEKALQYGMQHGIISAQKLDDICRDAPKGMVQIAGYFGSEFLRPELEKARERMVNLISLYLEDSCQGDLRAAAQSLQDNSFLSRSKGGSDMLKRLIAMPQTSHFGMNERKGFTDEHIPHLAKWTLRSLPDYRAELAQRQRAADLMDAAICLAEMLGTSADELEDYGADAEAVVRTCLLTLATKGDEMPHWREFGDMVLNLRKKAGAGKASSDKPGTKPISSLSIGIPGDLPMHLHDAVEPVRQSVLLDVPKMLDEATPIRKLFHQSPAFMGRYFWIESALSEVDHHERSASPTWAKATGGHTDEGSLLTLFLCIATSTAPKTILTERSAGTLVRKVRKTGLHPDLVTQYITAHAPAVYQADYVKLWQSFLDEARATLLSDSDYELKDALALLRRECVVQQA